MPDVLSYGKDLLYLVSSALGDTAPDKAIVEKMNLETLYRFAKFHSMNALVYISLKKYREAQGIDALPPELYDTMERDYSVSVKRLLVFDLEREALGRFITDSASWFLTLKGLVLQEYYPVIGARQMADNDILIDPRIAPAVKRFFTDRGYKVTDYGRFCHDTYRKGNILFEIHRKLVSDTNSNKPFVAYYKPLIKDIVLKAGGKGEITLSPEDFYLYFIVHAHKHFISGGCGYRMLTDIYLFLSKNEGALDNGYIEAKLSELGLTDFEAAMRRLAFGLLSSPPEDIYKTADAFDGDERELFLYLTDSGTFGTIKGHIKNTMAGISGGGRLAKFKYLWQRVFPPLEYYKQTYPRAWRFIVTIPFLWAARVFRSFSKTERLSKELSLLKDIDNDNGRS
ncbi:MAG: nucleotidyltransferase family protein [Clostridia bacterium]|nr:nucleotidyltransferase family protein [Clostridia bacterium]